MYEELVKALRDDNACLSIKTAHEAADAIEQLDKDLERAKEWASFWEKEANEAMWNEQLLLAEIVTDYARGANWLNTRDQRTLAQLRDTSVCVDSPIGEYRCQVEICFSPQSGREPICVDTCLQHEIHDLIFKHGVNTIGSCCGHGIKQAYIQVSPLSVQKMHELGYEPLPEEADGQGKWCFKPKTYFLEPVNKTYKFPENDLVNRFVPPDWKQHEDMPLNYCGAENRIPADPADKEGEG